MQRRFSGLFTALVLLTLVLTACGGGSSGGATTPSKVTVNWWHISTTDPGKTDLQNIANQYMKAHPNVTIKITILENDAFKSKLTTVMQSGKPPDLFHSWGGGVMQQYAEAGLLKDITPQLQGDWGNSFNQSALNVYGANGKYYGVPWDMGAVGFWYNKAIFTKLGIEAPQTWTAFLNVVKQIKAAGITPLAVGEKEKWPGHFYWTYLAVRLGGKAAFDKAYSRSGSFADQPFVQAGQYLQQLINLDPFQKGYLGSTYGDEQTLIANGKAAMELMGQWAPSGDAAVAKDKKGPELGFFPFPAVEGGAGAANDIMGGGNGIAVGKNAPPEAVDFLRYFTNVENQRKMAEDGLILPTVKGAADAVTNPQLQSVLKAVTNAGYFQLYYDQYLPPALGEVVKDATQGLFAKTQTPEAVAKAIEDSAASEIK